LLLFSPIDLSGFEVISAAIEVIDLKNGVVETDRDANIAVEKLVIGRWVRHVKSNGHFDWILLKGLRNILLLAPICNTLVSV
jgi:hypothetical protein